MSDLWPRIEPLLARVEKPARYIGCEEGSIVPVRTAGAVGWLLIYPDAYEIGLKNSGGNALVVGGDLAISRFVPHAVRLRSA